MSQTSYWQPTRRESDLEAAEPEIVERARQGDRDAFAELIRQYDRAALAVAFSILGNGDAAGDAAQEAFLRAWQRLQDLHDSTRFGGWLCGIVRNAAYDALRRDRRRMQ